MSRPRLPPLPKRRKKAKGTPKIKKDFEDRIKSGDTDAEEEYRDFLIGEGEYFFCLEEVLPVENIDLCELDDVITRDGHKRMDWARAFLRTKVPDYLGQGQGGQRERGVKEFQTTKECMMTDDSIATLKSKGHSTTTKQKIWDKDIFGRPFEEANTSEVAHLLPDAPNHAAEWYDVACWAIGTDPEDTGLDWETVFRLLHGTNIANENKRVFGSGLRHFVANKARINGQEKVLDKEDPQLLIIPILTRQECLDWNGEDYEAIVLVGANKDGKGQHAATTTIGLTDKTKIEVFDASHKELKLALRSLRRCTFAMVQSLVNYDPPKVPTNDPEERMKDARALRMKRRDAFLAAAAPFGTVPVPKKNIRRLTGEYKGICKICFSNSASEENYLHPAPDPILLLAHATVVWSVRNHIRLRASAVVQDAGVDEWENDVLQLELLARLKDAKKLDEKVKGVELTVEQRGPQASDSETSSLSSQGKEKITHLPAESQNANPKCKK